MKRKEKKPLKYYLKRDRFIYLLMLPGLLWYIIFCYLPMFGIIIAFEDYKPFWGIQGIFTSNWVGGKHFLKFFKSAYCFRLIKNTLLLSIYSLIWSFPLSIILALFINELKGKFFKKTVQTCILPASFSFSSYCLWNDKDTDLCRWRISQCNCHSIWRRSNSLFGPAGMVSEYLYDFRGMAEHWVGKYCFYCGDDEY